MSFENMKNDFLWNKLLEIKRKKKTPLRFKTKNKAERFLQTNREQIRVPLSSK